MREQMTAGPILGVLLLGGTGAIAQAAERVYVRSENRSVYVFPDRKSYDAYDLAACRNAVSTRGKDLAKLRIAARKGRAVTLSWRERPRYFDRKGFGPEYDLNWSFRGTALNPLCQDTALLEITGVR